MDISEDNSAWTNLVMAHEDWFVCQLNDYLEDFNAKADLFIDGTGRHRIQFENQEQMMQFLLVWS